MQPPQPWTEPKPVDEEQRLAWLEREIVDAYGREKCFRTVWFLNSFPSGASFDSPGPIPAGTVIRHLDKREGFDVETVVRGEGTWGDLWDACDQVLAEAIGLGRGGGSS
ncbi:hypothetical protein KIPB_004936 [Kipferlia bialata]|uniref:Uncharacterized protein n=1 Tax=Kipferlia bialata TaxID=797122 RepID=A0A391NLI7_9EUKA|nr:hypothetical protein KIPB_004936 [Kipferlia bialata]|eukprot:g4936.t1